MAAVPRAINTAKTNDIVSDSRYTVDGTSWQEADHQTMVDTETFKSRLTKHRTLSKSSSG